MCGIASAHSYPVTFLNTGCLQHDVQFLNFTGYIVVLQGSAFVVCQRIEQPVVFYRFFNV